MMKDMKMSKKPTIKDLEQKIGELTEALQRERADAENLRRRTEEEKSRLGGFYKAMVVQELLPALDNLERAFKHTPKELKDNEYIKGLSGVMKQFEQSFAQLGVKRIKTVGEVFDPRLHEAVHLEDGDGTVEVVCEELQPGYTLGDEVIRHAMVKVKMEKR
jgi:molecular chaperone GrpE